MRRYSLNTKKMTSNQDSKTLNEIAYEKIDRKATQTYSKADKGSMQKLKSLQNLTNGSQLSEQTMKIYDARNS